MKRIGTIMLLSINLLFYMSCSSDSREKMDEGMLEKVMSLFSDTNKSESADKIQSVYFEDGVEKSPEEVRNFLAGVRGAGMNLPAYEGREELTVSISSGNFDSLSKSDVQRGASGYEDNEKRMVQQFDKIEEIKKSGKLEKVLAEQIRQGGIEIAGKKIEIE